jgi:DNA-binding CsgD family transcriptional regulator
VAALATQLLGGHALRGDLSTARRRFEQALCLNRMLDDRRPQVLQLTQLGRLDLFEGDVARARERADESLALAQALDDAFSVARSLELRGRIEAYEHHDLEARQYFARAQKLARGVGNLAMIGNGLLQQGWLELRRGRALDAHGRLLEGLMLADRVGESSLYVELLHGVTGVSVGVDMLRAVRLAGAAAGVENVLHIPPVFTTGAVDPELLDRWLSTARRSLGESVFREAWLDGKLLSMNEAIRYGLETPAPDATARQDSRLWRASPLTAREEEIAGLIGRGFDNRRISEDLVITRATTERHVSNILRKLGFSSRAEIAVWVLCR